MEMIRVSEYLEYLSEDVIVRLITNEGDILFAGVKDDITQKLEDRMNVAPGSVRIEAGCLLIETIISED